VDARVIADEIALFALDYKDFSELVSDAADGAEDPNSILPLSVAADSSGNPLVTMTRSILHLTKKSGEIGIQATEEEFCESGQIAITEEADGYSIVFTECSYAFGGTNFVSDGTVSYQSKLNGGTITYQNLEYSLNKGGDSLALKANGTIDLEETQPGGAAGKVTLNISYDLLVSCGGETVSASFGYENFVIDSDVEGAIAVSGTWSFSFTGEGGFATTVAISTQERIRYEDPFGFYPTAGKVTAVADGQTIVIEFVPGGVWINGVFVSWEDLEADLDDDDFDDVFGQCSFFDSESDFDF